MLLTGLQILLTYPCTYECEHCFVWGSPNQTGVFTLAMLRQVFDQTKDTGTVKTILSLVPCSRAAQQPWSGGIKSSLTQAMQMPAISATSSAISFAADFPQSWRLTRCMLSLEMRKHERISG